MKYFFTYLLIVIFTNLGYGQIDFSQPDYIKTVILKPIIHNYYAPIIKLGESIQLSFDDLHADEHTYSYKIIHCDADWTHSNLSETEFVKGYAEDRINTYENAFNTLQPYTHYSVTFPNEHTELLISGNYIVAVLNEDNEVVFKRSFVVYEPKVTVGVALYKSRDISSIHTKQSVEFIINNPTFRFNNPSQEIYPVILQNNNWQTAISGLKPQFFRGTQILYKYNKETSYFGGNEFLFFDSKAIRNSSLNIAKAELVEDLYHTYLYTNEERIDHPYTYFKDINGNFIIRNLTSENPTTEADYSWVHFSLSCLENLEGKAVYVSGNFNNWQLNDRNVMKYNTTTGLYEAKILLKQGFYNYQFVTKNREGKISNYDIDGSFYETENDYTVLIYYKGFGSRYTQVIGVGFGNSEKMNN